MVHERQLKMYGTVKIIKEIAPVFKNGIFILILCQLVINIIEPNGLGIIFILHPADPVLRHLPVGNGLLCGNLFLPCFFLFCSIPAFVYCGISCTIFLYCRFLMCFFL